MTTLTPPGLRLALLATPGAPGSRAFLARARNLAPEVQGSVSVLLSGDGLEWIYDEELAALAREGTVEVLLCSRSAREAGLDLDDLPAWIRPSSLVAWLRDLDADTPLWSLLPCVRPGSSPSS